MTKRCLDPALLHAHPAAPDPDGGDGLHLHHPRRRRREVHLRQEVGHMEAEKGPNILGILCTLFCQKLATTPIFLQQNHHCLIF